MKYIKQFSEISNTDIDIAGGKGASLGEMTQAEFPIPEGFVITAQAYEAFLKSHPRSEDIVAQLNKVNPNDMNSIDRASTAIQDIIHDFAIPEGMQTEFTTAFKNLDAEYVAVRSSATAEDSKIASWAGELDTFLNTTVETYLDAIKKCWASLFSPRAIFYRHENKLEDAQVDVAVVVQKMVNADAAGVCFTVHPVTEDRNQMIIEACYGLGEALVSGQITPDSYVIHKDTNKVVDTYIGAQKMKIIRDNGINKAVELNAQEQEQQKISDDRIVALAQICRKIEDHYGFPVDIEWAIEGEAMYITQARPITTLSS